MTHSLPLRTPSSSRFSNTHTLTSLPVVLCVADMTFHRPTLNGCACALGAGDDRPDLDATPTADPTADARLVVDDEGDGPVECTVYADSVDDLPKRPDATASMLAIVAVWPVGGRGSCGTRR